MGMDYRNFLKKIFRKGNQSFRNGVLGGWYTHTPIHYDDNTLRWLMSVCCLPVKYRYLRFLGTFYGLIVFLWCNYIYLCFKRLKWALFCFMLI